MSLATVVRALGAALLGGGEGGGGGLLSGGSDSGGTAPDGVDDGHDAVDDGGGDGLDAGGRRSLGSTTSHDDTRERKEDKKMIREKEREREKKTGGSGDVEVMRRGGSEVGGWGGVDRVDRAKAKRQSELELAELGGLITAMIGQLTLTVQKSTFSNVTTTLR